MDRRHLLQATALGVGAATPLLTSSPLAAARRREPPGAVPEDLAPRLTPRRSGRLAGPTPSLAAVPAWRERPIRVPERYREAYFSATDDRGGMYGTLPGASDEGDSVLVLRRGKVTEFPVPGFRWTFPRAANRHGEVVITAEPVDTHGRTDSFLLRDGKLTRFPHDDTVPHLTAHGISDDGLISGRHGDTFATWRARDITRPRLRDVPFRDSEPRQCFLGADDLLIGNVVSVANSSYVMDVYRMRGEWSTRLRLDGAWDYQCFGVAGQHAILQVIDDNGYRAVAWDTSGKAQSIPGMLYPVEVNSSGLVAGYSAMDDAPTLLWQHGRLVGKIVTPDPADIAIILGITQRGEVFGQHQFADGRISPVIWTRY